MKAACIGCSSGSRASPSIVVTALPWQRAARVRQELIRRPSRWTVQAPQEPRSQPFFVPVRRRFSRSASSKVVRGSMVSEWRRPFTSSTTSTMSGVRTGAACPGASAARASRLAPASPPTAAAEPPMNRRRFTSSSLMPCPRPLKPVPSATQGASEGCRRAWSASRAAAPKPRGDRGTGYAKAKPVASLCQTGGADPCPCRSSRATRIRRC